MAKRIDIEESPYLRVLVYGKPGAGKTRFAGTSALDERTAPVLWLDASGNPESLRGYEKHPDVIRAEDLKDFNDPYRWIMKGQPEGDKFAQDFNLNPPYKTLVIDHLTDVQRMSYRVVLNRTNALPGEFNPPMEWSHHGQVLGQMLNFARSYFNIPMHVIMTAHEKRTTDSAGNLLYIEPLLWGQSGSAIPGYARIVGRLVPGANALREDSPILNEMDISRREIKAGVERILFVGQSARYSGKDQYGVIDKYLFDPSVQQIVDRLESS